MRINLRGGGTLAIGGAIAGAAAGLGGLRKGCREAKSGNREEGGRTKKIERHKKPCLQF
jgi:hypothetical protein